MKYKKFLAGLALLAVGFGLGFGVARRGQTEQLPKPNHFGWFEISSFNYSPDLAESEVDRRVIAMCKGAIEAHRNLGFTGGAEDVHTTLFGRLDQLPVNVIERNQTAVLEVVEEMLRSPYHQNVFDAQKFVMRHLELEWMANLARDYVRRFDEMDYAFGGHAHHLGYFLKEGGSADHTPETKAYTDFADYVVKHEEDLSERKSELNAREIHGFVEDRKKRDQ
jgi:hypothetical protein